MHGALARHGLELSGTPGQYYFSGAAGTCFWIDPAEELAVVFMTRYLAWAPGPRFNVARELRAIVYGALSREAPPVSPIAGSSSPS